MEHKITGKIGFDKVSTQARVTDWNLESSQELGHFNVADIPVGARILNVGSGFQQVFENELSKQRLDVVITSIDPSLVMLGYKVVLNGSNNWEDKFHVDKSWKQKERILGLHNQKNSIGALGQSLPLPSAAFNFGVDIYGAAKYAKDPESYKRYLLEIKRVIRGKFHIAEVYNGTITVGRKSEMGKRINAEYRLFEELGINVKLFTDEFSMQTKIGAILDL